MAEIKLSKKALFRCYANWSFFHLCSFSYERMEAFGFCQSMMPVIKELYPNNKEEETKALMRHTVFYNTEPVIGAMVPGIVAGIEETKANGADVDDDIINGVKAGLMGPLAGIGDSLFQGLVGPILLSIGISLAASGSVAGPLFYLLTFLPILLAFSYWIFDKGYKMGADSVNLFLGEKSKAVQNAMKVLGLIVIGGIGASYINFALNINVAVEGGSVSVQSFLDGVFPKFLPLLVLYLVWLLMVKDV